MSDVKNEHNGADRPPRISIVIPCLNEEKHIVRVLESLLDGAGDDVEVLVADGGSRDRTREIVEEFAEGERFAPEATRFRPRIRLLDNPERVQSAGMNIGIRAARGAYVVRADAHGVYPRGYVRRCVELLETTGAANAGGVQVPVPEKDGGIVQAAIALAMRHPLGAGDARWRRGRWSGPADTVYLGTYRRSIFDDVGLYDVAATPNEDAELNMRIRAAGFEIHLDHTLKVLYYPRRSLRGLARQYFRYGRARVRTALKHHRLTSWRQAAAPVLAAGLTVAVVAGFRIPALWLVPAAYVTAILAAAATARIPAPDADDRGKPETSGSLAPEECAEGRPIPLPKDCPGTGEARAGERDAAPAGRRFTGPRLRLVAAAAWVVMHMCWGAGFLAGLFVERSRTPRGTA